jgi:lipopolysaccharide/colanic/teichoic acid biosynthesis glycosyltransferase
MSDRLSRSILHSPASLVRGTSTVSPAYYLVKRVMDIALALVLLVVTLPVAALVIVATMIESGRHVVFVQERMGVRVRWLSGAAELRPFRMFKFRSMVTTSGSEEHRRHIESLAAGVAGSPGDIKLAGDPRVTRVGRVIRKLSIDEIPQLVNVLRGEMSIVGPRPVPLYEAELLQRSVPERFLAQPGITGLWQIKGRCALPYDEMQRLDKEYLRRRSVLLDLKILMLTIPAVLSTRGAG